MEKDTLRKTIEKKDPEILFSVRKQWYRGLLKDVMQEEYIEIWLNKPLVDLDGLTPLEALRAGKTDQLDRIIYEKSNYSIKKTYEALSNIENSIQALVSVSTSLADEDRQKLYNVYVDISDICGKFRWNNLEEIDSESYKLAVESGRYQTWEREKFRKHIERATKIVNSWPLWKQNILGNIGKPNFDTPRKPIDNG